jgi:hypothetical protein
MDILIFKTNLNSPAKLQDVHLLMRAMPGLHRWNVDMHDSDHVLRIESSSLSPRMVESRLRGAGYYCEEMED